MGVWIYLLILTAVVALHSLFIHALVKSAMDAEAELNTLHKNDDKADERLQNIEAWNDLAVIWMKGQKKRTTQNTVDIAALKGKSVFADPDPETEADDLFKEAEDCTEQS